MYHRIQPKFSRIGAFTHVDNVYNIREGSSKIEQRNNKDSNTIFHSSGKVTFDLNNKEYRYSEEQIRRPFRVKFSNESLCFFSCLVSCPSVQDLTRLIENANTTDHLAHGAEIIPVLRRNKITTQEEFIEENDNKENKENQKQEQVSFLRPNTIPSLNQQVNVVHADSGASVSIIREEIAEQLGTPIFTLANPLNILDINEGVQSYTRVCYIQMEIPKASFRAIVLAIVKKDAHIPFLLSNADQAAFCISPQADTREIRLGPKHRPQGFIKFLAYDEWHSAVRRPQRRISSAQLAVENRSLLRQSHLAKQQEDREIPIEILSHSGMYQQRIRKAGDNKTKISSEEIRQAARLAPQPEGPRAAAVQTLDHQAQLLLSEPAIRKEVDNSRRYDTWRTSKEVEELTLAKLDPASTDLDISLKTRQALQHGLELCRKIGKTEQSGILEVKVSSGTMTTIDENSISETHVPIKKKDIEDLLRLGEHWSYLQPQIVEVTTQQIPNSSEEKEIRKVESDDIYWNVLSAYLTAKSITINPEAEKPIMEIFNEEELEALNESVETAEPRLTPNKYEREYLPVFSGLFKPGKVPTKPVKPLETDSQEMLELHETEFLDPHFVPMESIAELNENIYNSERLRSIQTAEQKKILSDPARKEELLAELIEIKQKYCKVLSEELRPSDFREELWPYVFDDQKKGVAARFALFPVESRSALIKEIEEKLDISKQFGEELEKYMRAQALANLDVFGYPDPYEPPTIPGYTFRIQTIHDKPIYQNPQRFNQQESAFLDARIYELVNLTKVEPAPNSSHNLPLVLVPYTDRIKDSITKWTEAGLNPAEEMYKPSNYKEVATWYRLTNNLKALNDITIPYRYPMPDQNDPKHFTKGSRYWSVTDIKDAFFCINLHPDDRDKTAFTTPRGRFRFTVMPQGAMNSPTFFSNVAQDTFSHIPKSDLLNFIDDTTNHSRTFIKHLITQQAMYDALRSKRLIMKISKSHFLQDSVRCLGHIFSEFGHTPDPNHITAITEMAPPTNQTEVRSFLGLLNYNHNHIPRYSEVVAPLNDLLRKETDGVPTDVAALWDDAVHGEAFRKAKIALTSAPCMMAIDVAKPFVIHVDSCKNGRGPGAVLLQYNNQSELRPVAYFSCRLRKGETSWSATELEAMGLVYAIRYWSPYLKVQKFTAVVDHHALIWLVTRPAKTANGRILHWISDLQEYHFDIIHKAGIKHIDADAISRLLHYSDLPQRYPDSNDIVPPVDSPVTAEDNVKLYKQMIEARDYYLYLTSKTKLGTDGETAELPETDETEIPISVIPVDSESQDTLLENTVYIESELLFPAIVNSGSTSSSSSSSSSSSHNYTTITAERQGSEQVESSGNEDEVEEEENLEQARPALELDTQQLLAALSPDIRRWDLRLTELTREMANIREEGERLSQDLQQSSQEIQDIAIQRQIDGIVQGRQERKEQDQQAPLPAHLRPLVIRQNYEEAAKRGRGRPKKSIIQPSTPVGKAYNDQTSNFKVVDERIEPYKYLEHKIFIDPNTERVYKVVQLAFDRTNGVVAYRRCLDDDPPDQKDDKPWKVTGSDGIANLVSVYHNAQEEPSEPMSAAPATAWPDSEEKMLQLQKQDPNLQVIIEQLEADLTLEFFLATETKAFYLRRLEQGYGALRIMNGRDPTPRPKDKIVLPYSLRDQLIAFYHDEAGHPGRERTTLTIQQMYWWSGLRVDVESYIASCQYCQRHKPNNHAAKIPIQEYPSPTFPFEVCNMDLTGASFPKTKRGHQHILVVKDQLTRYVEIIPIKFKNELAIAKELVEKIYCRHGAPAILISDNGTEFVNVLMKQICVLLNIGRISTVPYHPQANGLVEQHNATLKSMLAVYVNRFQDDWDLYLPHVAYAYNTTISIATGYTPFCMLYGREARQLCNQWIDRYQEDEGEKEEYVVKLTEALQLGWNLAGAKKGPTVARWNTIAKARLPFKEFEIGSRFFLRTAPTHLATTTQKSKLGEEETLPVISSKLQARWTGPHKVTKKFSPVLYETVINNVRRVVHALHMKPDPIAEPLRANIPLARSVITELPRILEREHVSAVVPVRTPLQESSSSSSSSAPAERVTPQENSEENLPEEEEESD